MQSHTPTATTAPTACKAANLSATATAVSSEMPSVEILSTCKNVAAGDPRSASVACPDGTLVLSGGGTSATAREHILNSGRFPNNDSWGLNTSGHLIGPTTETAYVLCLRNSPPGTAVDEVAGSMAIPAHGTGVATASCQGAARAIGGGFNFPDSDFDDMNIYAAAKYGNSWVAHGRNSADGANIQLSAVVECLTASSARVTETSGSATLQPNSSATAQATCPAGSSLAGGGFSAVEPTISVQSSYPRDATTWAVMAHNPTGTTVALFAYAECLSFS
jgi:hypothetical protein